MRCAAALFEPTKHRGSLPTIVSQECGGSNLILAPLFYQLLDLIKVPGILIFMSSRIADILWGGDFVTHALAHSHAHSLTPLLHAFYYIRTIL